MFGWLKNLFSDKAENTNKIEDAKITEVPKKETTQKRVVERPVSKTSYAQPSNTTTNTSSGLSPMDVFLIATVLNNSDQETKPSESAAPTFEGGGGQSGGGGASDSWTNSDTQSSSSNDNSSSDYSSSSSDYSSSSSSDYSSSSSSYDSGSSSSYDSSSSFSP